MSAAMILRLNLDILRDLIIDWPTPFPAPVTSTFSFFHLIILYIMPTSFVL